MNIKLEHPDNGRWKVFASYKEAKKEQDLLENMDNVRYYIYATTDDPTDYWVGDNVEAPAKVDKKDLVFKIDLDN